MSPRSQIGDAARGSKLLHVLIVLLLGVSMSLQLAGCGGEKKESEPPRSALIPVSEAESAVQPPQATARAGSTQAEVLTSMDSTRIATAALAGESSENITGSLANQKPTPSVPPPAPGKTTTGAASPAPPATSAAVRSSQPTDTARLGPYCLQVGSFKVRDRAEQRAAELENAGYIVEIVEATVTGTLYYRVYLPNLPTQLDAEQLGERLRRSHGFDYLVKKID